MAAGQDEPDRWGLRENDTDGLDQLSNALAFDKASRVKHCDSFAGRLGGCRPACLNSIADDSDPAVNAGTILAQKLAFAAREADHAVGAVDHGFLVGPLPDALRWSLTKLVFGTIEGMHRVDKRDSEPLVNRACDVPDPEGMKMNNVGPPG